MGWAAIRTEVREIDAGRPRSRPWASLEMAAAKASPSGTRHRGGATPAISAT